VRKADNLPPLCAVVTKSGNFNFLEPSGPVQACNGTALPLPFYIFWDPNMYTGYVRRPDVDRLKRSKHAASYAIKVVVLDVY